MNKHPFFAVCDMIRRSGMVNDEMRDRDERMENLRHCFALGDMNEREFFREMRREGAADHEIAEFVQFIKGDE